MLKLYSKAFKAKTIPEIDSVAQEIHDHLLSSQLSHFERIHSHFSSTILPSTLNQLSVNYWINGKNHNISAEGYLLYVLSSSIYLMRKINSNEDKKFFISSLTFYIFSQPSYLHKLISSIPYVNEHATAAATVFSSMVQVYSNQAAFKSVTSGFLDAVSRHLLVSGLNFLYIGLRNKTRNLPSYLRLPINICMSMAFGHVNEKISTIGVKQYAVDIVDNIIGFFVKRTKIDRLPIDCNVEIPDSMKCEICHDLLVEPISVESQCFVCKECLDEWLKISDTNPKSGLPLKKDEIRRNIPMEFLVKNFYDIATK